MAHNEKLVDRIRELLINTPNVEEKKMFRGLTFMVNDKMCISVASDEIMCRVDPELHESLLEKKSARTMRMKGREYKGYILVDEEALGSKKELAYWVSLSLDFNKKAKSSKRK
jgi:TfoX/Sxy family transcriptional regulator of competence genes